MAHLHVAVHESQAFQAHSRMHLCCGRHGSGLLYWLLGSDPLSQRMRPPG